MTQNVRLQNLRDFTVQIRGANDQIVGTGIAVSTDGKIVTCAHVVRAAGVEPRNGDGAEVCVYFPQVRGGEEKKRLAVIARYFDQYDDDVVLLQLKGPSPLAPEQIPVLGTAGSSEENPFRSYGYRRLDQYIAGWAHGTIQGCVEAPDGFKVQCEPVQLESSQINSGMSGSAVLDMTRNLVVGIVSETWFPDLSTKDRDTAWAVDGRVLNLAPLGLPLQDISLPLKAAPEPKTDEETKQQIVQVAQVTVEQRTAKEKYSWNNAPATIPEWTGRAHLLVRLHEDWDNPERHVTGLIGFGGEGKSSLARRWVNDLLNEPSQPQPDGVFWWGFYENRSVDEFLEAALKYLSGGRIDPRAVPSSSLRAQTIGAMLAVGRYLFVLDGLEVMQHQDGDQYGLLQSNDLRDLLTFFAHPDNQSFCLITSRAPVLDLMNYTTYIHRNVERLSPEDGRTLLRVLGVKGKDAALDKAVVDWGGHALTLSVLAAYLVDRYKGDIKYLANIPAPTAEEPRYERVHRLLHRYDGHLTKDEREFLKLFSIFRLPVQESAFEKVFVPLLKVNKETLLKLVAWLSNYRLIRHDEREKTYTTHPLIRNHYFALFSKGDPDQEKAAHDRIKEYYLSIAGDTPQYPTLDDFKPLIEAVHHACQAGAYNEAHRIRRKRIDQENFFPIMHQLGAYETYLSFLYEFFPDADITRNPIGSSTDTGAQRFVLNSVGLCLMKLGRLRDAVPFYERAVTSHVESQDWHNASISYTNLAGLHFFLGSLAAYIENVNEGLELVRRSKNKNQEWILLANKAWAAHLNGNMKAADEVYKQTESLIHEVSPQLGFIYGFNGARHADYLRRSKQLDYARRVTEANLQICERNHWAYIVSMCHRVFGDLDSDIDNHESARAHYESAFKIARSVSVRDVLIEALLACGRWQAKHYKDLTGFSNPSGLEQAFADLNEALGYCVESGYRIYEADVRVALAWAYLANGEKDKARQSAERALQMSNEMGYYWGKVDAEEVLKAISY